MKSLLVITIPSVFTSHGYYSQKTSTKKNILASTKVMLFIPADLFMERFANLPEILNVRGPLRCWLPGEAHISRDGGSKGVWLVGGKTENYNNKTNN